MSRDFVIDASVTLAWCFDDEATPATQQLLENLATASAVVPALWHLEVANALVLSQRRLRLTSARANQFVELISGLPIITDVDSISRSLHAVRELAQHLRLTAYDASYLDVALRPGIPLATKDAELARAARERAVELLRTE